MVHVSGSTTLSPNTNYKILTGTVSEVLTLGADAISCHVNIGNEDDVNMLEDLSKLSKKLMILALFIIYDLCKRFKRCDR